MKVLVTGGAGFIGSYLSEALIELGYQVTVLDNLDQQVHPGGQLPAHHHHSAEFVRGDVRDYDLLTSILAAGHEIVFHMAAAVGIAQSRYQIKLYTDVNQGGTATLLDVIVNQKNRVRKLIVAGSMSSYGEGAYRCAKHGSVRPPTRSLDQMARSDWNMYCPLCRGVVDSIEISETAMQNANSVYAISKLNQEQLALNVGVTFNVPVTVLRYFNVYGPRQSLSNPYTGVSAIFVSRIKNRKSPVVYEDGQQTRDFVSIHDVVRANILALDREQADYQAINIGSGRPLTIESLATKIAKVMGKEIVAQRAGFRKGDVRHCFADINKAKTLLGFHPSVDLDEGLNELVNWSTSARAKDGFEDAEIELKAKGLVSR